MGAKNCRWLSYFLQSICLVLFIAGAEAQQSSRVRRASAAADADFVTLTRDVSDKAQDAWNALQNQRAEVTPELHMNVAAFAGAALALSQLAADNRDETVIRSGAEKLTTLAREIDKQADSSQSAAFRESWRYVQQQLSGLGAKWGLGYRASTQPGSRRFGARGAATQASGGWFRWQGRVDGSDQLVLQEGKVTIRHLQNSPITEASYEMSGPLPRTSATLRLNKLQGRGKVEIIGQPTLWNGFTCTILLDDPEGGSDFYRFEIVW